MPDTLGELNGPVTGVVRLPLRLNWPDRVVFHFEEPTERNLMGTDPFHERLAHGAAREHGW